MKHILFILTSIIGLQNLLLAQVPKIGNDTLVDMATWNIEWFGDTQNGPTDETLQFNNVKDIIKRTDIDVWSVCEISNVTVFNSLIADLPSYKSALATYAQTQKTGLIWKDSMFTKISAQHVLTDASLDYDFAGRPPFEVVLLRKDSIDQDTLYFYIVHLKAFADATSYGRRKNAAGHLKTFLDTYRKDKHIFVMGDWNDKISGSIWTSAPESPFMNLINDSLHYYFDTKPLQAQGKKSYYTGSLIDHIMMNNTLDSFNLPAMAMVLDQLPNHITNYTSTTSDHYPVAGFWNYRRFRKPPTPPNTVLEEMAVESVVAPYPNPFNTILTCDNSVKQIDVFDSMGRQIESTTQHSINTSSWSNGIVLVKYTFEDGSSKFYKCVHTE